MLGLAMVQNFAPMLFTDSFPTPTVQPLASAPFAASEQGSTLDGSAVAGSVRCKTGLGLVPFDLVLPPPSTAPTATPSASTAVSRAAVITNGLRTRRGGAAS